MSPAIEPPSATDHAALSRRIFGVLPAASYQMDRLLSLMGIRLSRRCATACIDCSTTPVMHLNPDFVNEHCRRDEHLFMLVMHELYHVILGHTRLFPRLTQLHNLAFDAVINAMLCHQFAEPRYTSFFQAINPWGTQPGRLLRPPPGWPPWDPSCVPPEASPAEAIVLRHLYGPDRASVTYHEIFELLISTLAAALGPAVLLGDHGGPDGGPAEDGRAIADRTLVDVLRRIVENWPPPPERRIGRDNGREPHAIRIDRRDDPGRDFRIALARLLRRAGLRDPHAAASRCRRLAADATPSITPLPHPGDRRAPVHRQVFGTPPAFYAGETALPRRRLDPTPPAHVYLDVSGSMDSLLPFVVAALAPLHLQGACDVFVFSTVVDRVHPRNLASGSVQTTFGTSIDCVFRHLAELPPRRRPRTAVILTDGYVGPPADDVAEAVRRHGPRLFVGLIGSRHAADLQPYAVAITELPPVDAPV